MEIYQNDPIFTSCGRSAGTFQVLKLAQPWLRRGRSVVADAAFASANLARRLLEVGVTFTGAVKLATSGFPRRKLDAVPLNQWQWSCFHAPLETLDQKRWSFAALRWVGRKNSHYITTLGPAALPRAVRAHAEEGEEKEADDHGLIQRPAPSAIQFYYRSANAVDVHNHLRQGSLGMERGLHTHSAGFRMLSTVLGIIITDAFRAYEHLTPAGHECVGFKDFYASLSRDLINLRLPTGVLLRSQAKAAARPQFSLHQFPICHGAHSMVRIQDLFPGQASRGQGRARRLRCRACHRPTIFCCRSCSTADNIIALCMAKRSNGQPCYMTF